MPRLSFRRVSEPLGVEVDFDLSQTLSDEVVGEIRELFDRHHLLLFRNQTFSDAQQVAFSKLFGPISRRSPAMRDKDTVMVSNSVPGGVLGSGELLFHSDNTFFQHPLRAIGLYAIELPDEGGDTLFANCFAVYESLPQDLKDQLEELTSLQLFDYNGEYNNRSSLDAAPPDAPRAVHPLVWTDPKTGRKSLFFSEHTTARINELTEAEELALFERLRSAISDPRFGYRHKWRVGDFVFWDNIALQHARTDFDAKQARTLRRTPVLDPDGDTRFPHSRDVSLTAPLA